MTSEAPPSTTRRAVAPVAGRRVIFAGFLEALSDGAVWRPRYGVAVVDEADDAVGDGAAVGLELFEHAECSAAIEFLRGAARPFVLAELGRWGCGGFALDVAGFAPRLFRAPAEQDAGKWRNALGGPPVHLAIASSDVVHRGDVIVDGKRRFVELRSNGDLHQYRYGPTIDAGARWRDHLLDTLSLQSGAKLLVREDGRSFQLNVGDRGAAKRWICTAPLDEGTGGHVEMNAWIAVLRPLADVRHEDAEASPVLEAAPFEEAASGTVHEDPYTLASKLGKVAFVGGVAVAVVAGAGAGTTLALLSGLASAGAGAVATRARRDAKTSADAQLEADAAALRAAAVASLADAGDAAAGRHADVVATVRVRISRVRLVLANDALPPTLRLAGAAANGRARGDASQKMSITLKCGDDEVSLEDFTCLQTEAAVDDAGTHLFFDQAGPAAPQVDHTFHATSTRYAVRIEVKRAGLLLATRVISIFELAQRDAERDVRSAHAALRQLKALVLGPDARPPQDRHAAAGGREGTADEGCFSHDAFHARLRETGERAADGAAWYTMHGTVSDDDDDEAPPSADAAPKESPAGLPSTAFVDGADGGQSSKRILALCEARLDLKWETFLGDGHRADLDRPPRDEVLRPEATLELLRRAFAFVSWVMLASRTLDELLRWDDPKTSFAVLAIGVGCALLWAREHFFALPLVALLAVMLWHGHQRFSGVWLARRVLYREKGDDNLSDLASNRPPRDAATLRLAVRRIDLGVDGGEAPPKIVVKYVPSTAVAALHARIVDAAAIECCASLLRGDAFPPKEAAEALEAARDACKAAAARARAFSGGGGAPLVGDWAIAPIRVGSGVALRRRRRRKGDEEATQGAADEVAGQGLAASSEAASSVWDYAVASVSRTLAPVSQPAPPPAIDASAVHRGLGFLRKAGGALGADVGLAHVGVASRAQYEADRLLRWMGVHKSPALFKQPARRRYDYPTPAKKTRKDKRADAGSADGHADEDHAGDDGDASAPPRPDDARAPRTPPRVSARSEVSRSTRTSKKGHEDVEASSEDDCASADESSSAVHDLFERDSGFEARWECGDGSCFERAWEVPVLRELLYVQNGVSRTVDWADSQGELHIKVYADARRGRGVLQAKLQAKSAKRRVDERANAAFDGDAAASGVIAGDDGDGTVDGAAGSSAGAVRLIGTCTLRLKDIARRSDTDDFWLQLDTFQAPGRQTRRSETDDGSFSEVDEPLTSPPPPPRGAGPRIQLRCALDSARRPERFDDLEEQLERPVFIGAAKAGDRATGFSFGPGAKAPPPSLVAADAPTDPPSTPATPAGGGLLNRLRRARRSAISIQNTLRDAVRCCEQMKALLQWAHPRSTGIITLCLAAALIVACSVRADVLATFCLLGAFGHGALCKAQATLDEIYSNRATRVVSHESSRAASSALKQSASKRYSQRLQTTLSDASGCATLAADALEKAHFAAMCTPGPAAAKALALGFSNRKQVLGEPLWQQALRALMESLPAEAEVDAVFGERRAARAWHRERVAVRRALKARWAGPLWRQSTHVWRRHFAAVRHGQLLEFWYSAAHALMGVAPVLVVDLGLAVVTSATSSVLTLHAPVASLTAASPREWRLATATAEDLALLRRLIGDPRGPRSASAADGATNAAAPPKPPDAVPRYASS